jgi:CDP-diacylglycerol---glycerol-3-phosphate 3-phosphatidyltransferase
MSDKRTIKERLRGLLAPVVIALERAGVSPMAVTIAGLVLSFAGAGYVAAGRLRAGAIVLLIAGLCDTIDGSLARSSGKASRFGAFLDSTLDRVAELAYFSALVYHFASIDARWSGVMIWLTLAALAGSLLTSYARARAEGLGLECSVGILERPERVALLFIGLLFGHLVLNPVIALLAVLSIVTFIQRVMHVRSVTL